jgi:predicted  nucleic acid-binding Zn-ribbon protein
LLKSIETDESECDQIQSQIDEQKKHLEERRTEAEVMAGKCQVEIDKIQAEWDEVAKDIPEKPLEIFKRVTETYDGQAVALIEQQGGKKGAYSCDGCFMGLTAECVNLLMTKDDIIRCPNCTRILVLGDSLGS